MDLAIIRGSRKRLKVQFRVRWKATMQMPCRSPWATNVLEELFGRQADFGSNPLSCEILGIRSAKLSLEQVFQLFSSSCLRPLLHLLGAMRERVYRRV
jgi:hypothetical protein